LFRCPSLGDGKEQQHTDRQAAHDSNPHDDRSAHDEALHRQRWKRDEISNPDPMCETRLRRDVRHVSGSRQEMKTGMKTPSRYFGLASGAFSTALQSFGNADSLIPEFRLGGSFDGGSGFG